MTESADRLVRMLPQWQLGVFRFNDAVAARMNIASSDLQCLFMLDRAGPSTPGLIAQRVGLSTGAASRMIDRLVAADLVTRETDATDRRRAIVTIRPESSAQLHARYDPLDDRLRDLLEEMPEETRTQLLRFVEQAIEATSDVAGAAG